MYFVRFEKSDKIYEGILSGDTVQPLEGSFFGDYRVLPQRFQRSEVKLLAPCLPSKILCVGLNYRDHAEEVGLPIPQWPVIFSKGPNCVIGPEEAIIYPSFFVKRLDYEAELAVVIKKTAKNVSEEEATSYVLGYTCANDVTARNLQPKEGQWTISKSFDTFLPLGPAIVSGISPDALAVSCRVNGVLKQSSNTRHFIFSVPYLVSYLSKVMTLFPGDVIITGTPAGISPIVPGDAVTVSIEGIGDLENRVVQAEVSL